MNEERHAANEDQRLVRRIVELEEELDKAIAAQASIRSKLEEELSAKRALLKKEISLRLSLQRENRNLVESQNKLRHLLAVREGDLAIARRAAKSGGRTCMFDVLRSLLSRFRR